MLRFFRHIAQGNKPEEPPAKKAKEENTPLIDAIEREDEVNALLMIRNNRGFKERNLEGDSPLHVAFKSLFKLYNQSMYYSGPEKKVYLQLHQRVKSITEALIAKKVGVTEVNNDGQLPLHVALARYELSVPDSLIVELMAKTPKALHNSQDAKGLTPLMILVLNRRYQLVSNFPIDNQRDRDGNTVVDLALKTVVHYFWSKEEASACNHFWMTALDCGVELDPTWLYVAIIGNNMILARELINRGIGLNHPNYMPGKAVLDVISEYAHNDKISSDLALGDTPVMSAIRYRRLDLVELLLANEKIDLSWTNLVGESTLDLLIKSELLPRYWLLFYERIINWELLSENGIFIKVMQSKDRYCINDMLSQIAQGGLVDVSMQTVLKHMIDNQLFEQLNMLLEHKAFQQAWKKLPHYVDDLGNLLIWAIKSASVPACQKTTKILLEELFVPITEHIELGLSALLCAISHINLPHNQAVAISLIETFKSQENRMEYYLKALEEAKNQIGKSGMVLFILRLIQHLDELQVEDPFHRELLMWAIDYACFYGNDEFAVALIDKFPTLDFSDPEFAPLEKVLDSGKNQLALKLLERDANSVKYVDMLDRGLASDNGPQLRF